MSQKEKEILENMAKALPNMPDIKKGELLGYAKAMVDLKKIVPKQEDGGEKEDDREEVHESGRGGAPAGN